jgi:hypothetical protein
LDEENTSSFDGADEAQIWPTRHRVNKIKETAGIHGINSCNENVAKMLVVDKIEGDRTHFRVEQLRQLKNAESNNFDDKPHKLIV